MGHSVKASTLAPHAADPEGEAAAGGGNTIRVVSASTGLAMETLRAWERRYGFPRPERRAGSNRRLYSAADIERLVAIQRALERGYRVGDVIGKTIAELGALTDASGDRASASRYSSPPAGTAGASGSAGATGSAGTVELIELLAREQLHELEARLRNAAVALGPRRFITDVAHPFAVGVGQAWAESRISIHHEHLATECLVTQIRQMLASFQGIESRPLVLLATLPGEAHTLPLQMVALYLVAVGAKPRLLGGSAPPRAVAECAERLGVDAVGVTVTAAADRKRARKDVKSLRGELPGGMPLWIGGAGAEALSVAGDGTHAVTSWEAIDEAVARCRDRSGRRDTLHAATTATARGRSLVR